MTNFYLSPICTNCLGDALISISNIYAKLTKIPGKITVYYHHWPKYYDILWPLIEHPRDDIYYVRLETPTGVVLDNRTEALWKPSLLKSIRRSDFYWHPARAYSKVLCEIHPVIVKTLLELKIDIDRVLLNCTDLDPGERYLRFNKTVESRPIDSDLITFQSESLRDSGQKKFNLDVFSKVEKIDAVSKIEVSWMRSVEELVCTLARSRHHYGIDSGPTHLALALGTPVTVFYSALKGHRSLESITNIYRNYLDQMTVLPIWAAVPAISK